MKFPGFKTGTYSLGHSGKKEKGIAKDIYVLDSTDRQYRASLIACLGAFSLGYALSFSSPSLPKILAEGTFGNVSRKEIQMINSLPFLGTMLASPLAGLSADYFGRKRTMMLAAAPLAISWGLIGISSSISLLFCGRFLSGFFAAPFAISVPIYISEISESKIRGRTSNMFQLMLVIGVFYTNVIGAFASWRCLAFTGILPPVIFFTLFYFVPESPQSLLVKGERAAAKGAIYWLRSIRHPLDMRQINADEDLKIMEESVEKSRAKPLRGKDICQGQLLKPLFISISLVVFKSPMTIFYAVNVFKAAGTAGTTLIDENASMWIVCSLQVFATLLSTFLVDKAGRRPLIISSEFGMTISLFALAIFFRLKRVNDDVPPVELQWLPLTSLGLFIIAFSIGIGPLSWTISGEILAPRVKGVFSAVAISLNYGLSFMIAHLYFDLIAFLGNDGVFFFFTGVCFLGTIVVFFCVPETKGKNLENIQQMFEKIK